jgi:hypothetical protein
MPQKRSWNFKADDATKDINRWLTGFLSPGLYFGFDFSPSANMTLGLVHTVTGFKDVGDGLVPVESSAQGLVVTRQGVVITEDTGYNIAGIAVGDAVNPRIDIVVVTHQINEIAGGATALYSVIQGTPGATPVAPALSNPNTQVKIGELYIPANTTALNQTGVKWVRSGKPGFAGTQYATSLVGVDANDINSSGTLFLDGTSINTGTPSFSGYLISTFSDINNGIQLWLRRTADGFFFRRKNSGAFSSWYNITTPLSGVTGAITTVLTSNLTANRVVVSDGSGKIVSSGITTTELNQLAGIGGTTIVTQLNTKLSKSGGGGSNAMTGYFDMGNNTMENLATGIAATSAANKGYIDSALSAKQNNITGAITTVLSSNLTNNRVVVSDGSGKVISSGITDGELNTLSGISSNIQSQLNTEATARANGDDVNQTAWRTDASWATNWATSGSIPLKFKIFNGLLIIKGGASKTGAVADGDLMFTLPSGCRVDSIRVISVISNGVVGTDQVATFSVVLSTNGDVTLRLLKNAGVSAINTPIYLDNICLPIS